MFYSSFASESVCAGHPDKICDQISDTALDEALKQDKHSHTGIECLVTTNKVIVAGEVKTKAKLDFPKIAKEVVKSIGFNHDRYQFNYKTADFVSLVHQQSPDIQQGVDVGGAGDQGMMFGYACKETKQLMPLPIMLAHGLTQKMDELHQELSYLRPDGKSQVVVEYKNQVPHKVVSVVLAKPHDQKTSYNQVKKDLYQKAVVPVIESFGFKPVSLDEVILNGTGKWEIGGPHSDMGETGRKIPRGWLGQ